MYETKSAPAPPYSSGTQTPIRPSAPSFGMSSDGKRCSRSHSAACGSISACANSRATAWISRCSCVSSKSICGDSSEESVTGEAVREDLPLGDPGALQHLDDALGHVRRACDE